LFGAVDDRFSFRRMSTLFFLDFQLGLIGAGGGSYCSPIDNYRRPCGTDDLFRRTVGSKDLSYEKHRVPETWPRRRAQHQSTQAKKRLVIQVNIGTYHRRRGVRSAQRHEPSPAAPPRTPVAVIVRMPILEIGSVSNYRLVHTCCKRGQQPAPLPLHMEPRNAHCTPAAPQRVPDGHTSLSTAQMDGRNIAITQITPRSSIHVGFGPMNPAAENAAKDMAPGTACARHNRRESGFVYSPPIPRWHHRSCSSRAIYNVARPPNTKAPYDRCCSDELQSVCEGLL